MSPHYFLKTYGKVRDTLKGVIPFEDWAHLVDLLYLFENHRLLIIMKARQLYITWLVAGYGLWKALFHEAASILYLSKGETEATEVLDYCRFYNSQLPDFLRVKLMPDQTSVIGLPASLSKIRALPATEDAGIGLGGATLIILDEWERHPYADRNYSEIKPMIDKGGQMIILSAVDKLNQNTKFKQIWREARAGKNNFYPIFLPYNLLSYRTEEWYQGQRKDYDNWEMEARYPRTEAEALSAPQLVCRFDVEALKAMQARCSSPMESRQNGLIRIYRKPAKNERYIFAIDSSEGAEDPVCGGIIDKWGERVAGFYGKIPIDEQAFIAHSLYEEYNYPYTAVERNAAGLTLIEKLKDMGITRWHMTAKDKEGWWTSSKTRPIMLIELAEAVRLQHIKEPDEKALDEFFSFVRTEKKPDGAAVGGAHDDWVMMWAIAWQIRKTMPIAPTMEPMSFEYQIGA